MSVTRVDRDRRFPEKRCLSTCVLAKVFGFQNSRNPTPTSISTMEHVSDHMIGGDRIVAVCRAGSRVS